MINEDNFSNLIGLWCTLEYRSIDGIERKAKGKLTHANGDFITLTGDYKIFLIKKTEILSIGAMPVR